MTFPLSNLIAAESLAANRMDVAAQSAKVLRGPLWAWHLQSYMLVALEGLGACVKSTWFRAGFAHALATPGGLQYETVYVPMSLSNEDFQRSLEAQLIMAALV